MGVHGRPTMQPVTHVEPSTEPTEPSSQETHSAMWYWLRMLLSRSGLVVAAVLFWGFLWAATGCSPAGKQEPATITLTEVTLPGLKIALPSGEVNVKRASRAREGMRTVGMPGGHTGFAMVQWHTEQTSEEDIRTTVSGIAKAHLKTPWIAELAVTESVVAGVPAKTYRGDLPKGGSMVMTLWRYGEREILLTTMFAEKKADTLHKRILASVQCSPVELEAPLVPRLALPGGWARLRVAGSTSFANVAGEVIHYEEGHNGAWFREKGLARSLRSVAGIYQGAVVGEPTFLSRSVSPLKTRTIGQQAIQVHDDRLYITVFLMACAPGGISLKVTATTQSKAVPEAFLTARCPGFGMLPTYPDAIAAFGSSCDDGDGAACALLASLTGDTGYPLMFDEAAKLRAEQRACALGETAYCDEAE
jgi:hypothetical protein